MSNTFSLGQWEKAQVPFSTQLRVYLFASQVLQFQLSVPKKGNCS